MKNQIVCFEPRSGSFFRASTDELDLRLSVFNECLNKNGFVTFNEYLRMLGLSPMRSGDLLGWSKMTAPDTIGYSVNPIVTSPYVFSVDLEIEPSVDYMDF